MEFGEQVYRLDRCGSFRMRFTTEKIRLIIQALEQDFSQSIFDLRDELREILFEFDHLIIQVISVRAV